MSNEFDFSHLAPDFPSWEDIIVWNPTPSVEDVRAARAADKMVFTVILNDSEGALALAREFNGIPEGAYLAVYYYTSEALQRLMDVSLYSSEYEAARTHVFERVSAGRGLTAVGGVNHPKVNL